MTSSRRLAIGWLASWFIAATPACSRTPDVPYQPTPEAVVEAMLDLAGVGIDDLVYDLGSGDGRIVIAAARRGARAVGVEVDPELVKLARENARLARVSETATFIEGDLFQSDFSRATVVTMYLFPHVNLRLKPTLMKMAPGTRIVSHSHDLGDWRPDRVIYVRGPEREHKLLYWVVPGK